MDYLYIENGLVTNVIVWDGESLLSLPDGVSLVPADGTGAWIGWRYEDGKNSHLRRSHE
jgi:hypothetical protein